MMLACGVSQVNVDATATQAAANNFATQTAQVPTATKTFTPTTTPTTTPTPTQIPTSTPTKTPTITPTPAPGVADLAPTIYDLPPGFEPMPPDLLIEMQKQFPEGVTAFAFSNDENEQMIMGFIIPVPTRTEQTAYDSIISQFNQIFLTSVGADTGLKQISGINDLGDARSGTSAVGKYGPNSVRWDVISFRRGEAFVILMVAYPDGDQPSIPAVDLARIIDERNIEYFDTKATINAPTNTDPISGKWTGMAVGLDSGIETQIDLNIQAGCTPGEICGTFSAVDENCSGDLELGEIRGNTFVFAEQNISGASTCVSGADESMRLLSNKKLFWKYEYTSSPGVTDTSTGVLEKH